MDAGSPAAVMRTALLDRSATADRDEERRLPPVASAAALSLVPFDAADFAAAEQGAGFSNPVPDAVAAKLAAQKEKELLYAPSPARGASGKLHGGGGGGAGSAATWRSLSSVGVAAAITLGFVLALALRHLLLVGIRN